MLGGWAVLGAFPELRGERILRGPTLLCGLPLTHTASCGNSKVHSLDQYVAEREAGYISVLACYVHEENSNHGYPGMGSGN